MNTEDLHTEAQRHGGKSECHLFFSQRSRRDKEHKEEESHAEIAEDAEKK